MTTFIMGHGEASGPPAFVPGGRSVGIYAKVDTLLAITVGMAVLAEEGGLPPATSYVGTHDEKKTTAIANYRMGPLTHTQLQRVETVRSSKNVGGPTATTDKQPTTNPPEHKVFYIGYDEPFMGVTETQLCTAVEVCAKLTEHTCKGLLGVIKDPDIRLVFCLGRAVQAGEPGMTLTGPETPEWKAANQKLAEYAAQAQSWIKRIQTNPAEAIPEFHKLAGELETAQQVAFMMASKQLDELLFLADARVQRQTLSPGAFLSYLYGLPEGSRALVVKELREEPGPRPRAMSALDQFFSDFFSARTEQRLEDWDNLEEPDQRQAVQNKLVDHWRTRIVPVVRQYQELLVPDNQPAGWFEAFMLKTDLSETEEAEAKDLVSYKAGDEGRRRFMAASPEVRLALWQQLQRREDVKPLLFHNAEKPDTLKSLQAPKEVLRSWMEEYRQSAIETKPAPAAEPSSGPEPDDTDDYWEDLDALNRQAAKYWNDQQAVHVAHLEKKFKFADPTKAPPAPAAATWSKFKVVGVGFTSAELEYVSGPIDLADFAAYLETLPGTPATLRQTKP